ncbi:MAG: ComEC/Rec2 family competence protein, partial [Sphingobacteriales bacterium]|nr:ComEC/Rec2 family competence protein [Sphingobacteriales bacterium]
ANTISEILPQPQAPLLSGILLGEKSDLPGYFNNNLRKTSTIHIVVVSGQNLTLVSGFIMSLASILGRRKTLALSLLASLFYAVLTGLQVPVIRAALMVGFSSIAQFFGREKESPWILILTGLLMLIYNPNWLLSISFQLSILATVGVVIVAPELENRINFLPDIIKQDLIVSFCAQALTWPIIAANFHQFSLIGLLVIVLVLWTVSFIMMGGIVALSFGLISLTLGKIFGLFSGVLLTYFIYIVNFFGSLSFANIYFPKTSILVWIGYYLIVLALFLALKQESKKAYS